jgi:hypothetical protein
MSEETKQEPTPEPETLQAVLYRPFEDPPSEFHKTAAEAFAAAMVADHSEAVADTTPSSESSYSPFEYSWHYSTSLYNGQFITSREPGVRPAHTPPSERTINDVKIQPWPIPLHRRLDRQATAVRKRLEDPDAVMLVMRTRTYSAKSVWKVFWLFLMVKLFGLPKPKKVKKSKQKLAADK